MSWFSRKKIPVIEQKSASYIFGAGSLKSMQQNYETLASEGYGINPVVRACVDKIAVALTSVDIKAYVKDKSGALVDMPNHPLLTLLNKPNPSMTGEDFISEFTRYFLIAGNAYVYGAGIDFTLSKPKPPSGLYIFKPNAIKIIAGDGYLPVAYEYRTATNITTYPVDRLTGISAILHKKIFNPLDTLYGLSPMTAAAFGIDILNEGARWNLRLLQNAGRPSGALIVKGVDGKTATLSDSQYTKLREELEQQFSGSNNAGRPLLLEGGMEWQEMSMNAKDMDFEKSINNAKRDIALVYGVPPMLLGIQGDSTYANMAEARLALWTDTILPLLRSILSSLNNWLAPMYGDGVILWYDEDMIPALEPLRSMKAARIEASTTLTINEKRDAMGFEAVDGGNTIFVDAGKVPLELAGSADFSPPPAF